MNKALGLYFAVAGTKAMVGFLLLVHMTKGVVSLPMPLIVQYFAIDIGMAAWLVLPSILLRLMRGTASGGARTWLIAFVTVFGALVLQSATFGGSGNVGPTVTSWIAVWGAWIILTAGKQKEDAGAPASPPSFGNSRYQPR